MNPLLEAALFADGRANDHASRACAFEADINSATSALAAIGAATAYVDAMAESKRWIAVAAKLRNVARRQPVRA